MVKIAVTRSAIIKITITAALALFTIYANFIAIKRMAYYAIRANFYDKLSVAYDIGGIDGLKYELVKIRTRGKLRYEPAAAAELEKRLGALKDPEGFIDNALSENKKKIMLFRNLRSAAIALTGVIYIFIFFGKIRPAKPRNPR